MASPAALSVVDSAFCNMNGQEITSHASVLVKDASKRKRVNRKLKQCKLDARREQWLSQVTMIKQHKDTQNDSPSSSKLDLGEIIHPDNHDSLAFSSRDSQHFTSEKFEKPLSHSHLHIQAVENREEKDLKDECSASESGSCVTDYLYTEISPKSTGSASPKSKLKKVEIMNGEDSRKKCSNEVKFKGGAAVSKETDEYVHDSGSEDWETAADALGLYASQEDVSNTIAKNTIEKKIIIKLSETTLSNPTTPISATPCDLLSRSFSTKAWRPDDALRPASLPNLSKQQSLPIYFPERNQRWVGAEKALKALLSGPSTCPICAEELDPTDSSFEPCLCGFQLCLFCHHRIALEDGRCPGCRRFYSSSSAASLAPSSIMS